MLGESLSCPANWSNPADRSNCASHYVAFIRKALQPNDIAHWVLFNDEKVVGVPNVDDMKRTAYVYFFKRER
jgi:uncharacterized UBP type Zn finger protein